MTQEEKARAYDEAIKKAESLYKVSEPMSGCNVILETIFPELKENEDERIRKALIEYFNEQCDMSDWNGVYGYQVVSWLEKQETSYTKRDVDKCNSAWSEEEERYICQLESMVKEKWALAEKAQDEEVIKNMSNLAFFLKTLNPNKKPADEEMKTLLRTEYEKGRADAIAEIQKRWSEEDELQMQAIIDLLPGLTIRHNWLKSLKGRVQPKQEWSEEDSVKLQRIIDFLWYNRKGDTDAIYQQEQDIDWLKSLRPKNRWKPSDGQMKALNYVVNLMASSESPKENDYYYNVFKDLRKQLKKLKEE